jgi:hypothetical protein
VTAAIIILAITVVGLSDRGLRSELLAIAQRAWPDVTNSTELPGPQNSGGTSTSGILPEPDSRGVITLTHSGPFDVRDLAVVGPLIIQAVKGVRPRIAISSGAWHITAQVVMLKDIDLEWTGGVTPLEPSSLLELHTQRFQISGCRFIHSRWQPSPGTRPTVAIRNPEF